MKAKGFFFMAFAVQTAMASGHDGNEYEELRRSNRSVILTLAHEVRCVTLRQTDGSVIAFGRLTLPTLPEQIELRSPVQNNCARVSALAHAIAQRKKIKAAATFVLGRKYAVDRQLGQPTGPGRLICTISVIVPGGLSFALFNGYLKDQTSCL